MNLSPHGCRGELRLEETEKIGSKDCIETFTSHTMTDMNPRRNLVKTDMESTKLSRNLNWWQRLKYNQSWMHTGTPTKT